MKLAPLLSVSILSIFANEPPTYHNRAEFLVLSYGYERIAPDQIYYALTSWTSPNYLSQSDEWLVSIEARLGYNICFKQKTLFTPFVGGGYLNDYKLSHEHEREYLRKVKEHTLEFGYFAYGVFINHNFNKLFELGLNLKGLCGLGTIGSRIHNNEWTCGLDMGVPITLSLPTT